MMTSSFGDLRKAHVNGASLAWREVGDGDPVVFVHGGVADLRVWDEQLPEIGRAYRAISYSRRYARPNEDIDPEAPDPWEPHADDLAAFVREIGAAPAHLVGSSQGAFIAVLAAIRYPELFRTLVLQEPPMLPLFVSFPPKPIEFARLFVTRPRTAIAILRFVTGTLAPVTKRFERGEDAEALAIFLRGVLGERPLSDIPGSFLVQARENLSTLRAGLLHAGFPPIDDEDVRGVKLPVLLITGDRSPTFLLRVTDRLEELLPDVERVEIADSSHGSHFETPQAFNKVVLEFLSRRG